MKTILLSALMSAPLFSAAHFNTQTSMYESDSVPCEYDRDEYNVYALLVSQMLEEAKDRDNNAKNTIIQWLKQVLIQRNTLESWLVFYDFKEELTQ